MKTQRILQNLTIAVALAVFPTVLFAQKIDIKDITSIDIDIACQLVLVQGNSPNMEIVGEKDAVAKVKTEIRNGKLTLSSSCKRQCKEDVVVKIEVKDLKRLGIGGVVEMKNVRTLAFADFELDISGVANIEMNLESESFKLESSGVANIDLLGKTNNTNMHISGVGNIDAKGFSAKNAKVCNSGIGNLTIDVEEKLDAEVSGLGTIYYTGNPTVNSYVSGLGNIKRN
jgi:hypothetical protein